MERERKKVMEEHLGILKRPHFSGVPIARLKMKGVCAYLGLYVHIGKIFPKPVAETVLFYIDTVGLVNMTTVLRLFRNTDPFYLPEEIGVPFRLPDPVIKDTGQFF